MIRSLSKLAVCLADLMEAEGRVARFEVLRLVKISLLYVVSCVLLLSGALILVAGLYLFLAEIMPPGFALMSLGVSVLIISIGIAALTRRRESPSQA